METNESTDAEVAGSDFDIREWIGNGLTWPEYLAGCKQNVDRMKSLHDAVPIPGSIVDSFKSRGPLEIICIAEDWCPDSSQNLPLLVKLVEELPQASLHLFFRDRNEKLMNHYLTNGKRVIPRIIFFDGKFKELGRWSGPSKRAKKWTDEVFMKGRRIEDIPKEEMGRFDGMYDAKFLEEFYADSLSELKSALG